MESWQDVSLEAFAKFVERAASGVACETIRKVQHDEFLSKDEQLIQGLVIVHDSPVDLPR